MPRFDIHIIISVVFAAVLGCDISGAIMILSANFIDIDHLTARPIFDPERSSFVHPLHKYCYLLLIVFYIIDWHLFLGLLLHVFLDYLDAKRLIKVDTNL